MSHRFAHARRNPIPYLLLAMAIVLAVGGGYALAASKVKTITVCADKQTGVLHLKTHGKCKRGQTRVTWNQRGPQGPQGVAGAQGPAGQPGAPAVNAWANVANDGSVRLRPGHRRAACLRRHLPGDDHGCRLVRTQSNAPRVSVSDTSSPGGQRRRVSRRLVRSRQASTNSSWCSPAMSSADPSARPITPSRSWTPACSGLMNRGALRSRGLVVHRVDRGLLAGRDRSRRQLVAGQSGSPTAT